MGGSSSKSSTTTSGPGKAALAEFGPQRIEQQYQSDMSDPNRLVPQARGLLGSFLQPEFADPRSNPYFSGAMDDIMGQSQQRAQSMFGMAGRGNSNSASGAGGYFADQFSRAAMPTLANMFQQRQGMQLQAGQMSGALDAANSLPLEQYLERARGLASMDTNSKTSTSNPTQTIAGIGLMALGAMTANPMLMAGGASVMGAGGGGMGGMTSSDRRLKTDVERIGDDPRGFGIYRFRYLWDEPGIERIGVMAQEIAPILPKAVAMGSNGFLMVDYGAL